MVCGTKWGRSAQASLRKSHLMKNWKEVASTVRVFQANQQPEARRWRQGRREEGKMKESQDKEIGQQISHGHSQDKVSVM